MLHKDGKYTLECYKSIADYICFITTIKYYRLLKGNIVRYYLPWRLSLKIYEFLQKKNTDQLLYCTSTTYKELRPNLYSPIPLFLELRQFGQPVKQKG